ncbi:MAG: DUF559 domain-containing protein [Polyangiaceae bacterium]|nr:DUF559 domain-containing protein [Polyangiaceae bacterium]
MTPSEARLWSRLNARQLGVTFRRQVPLGRYIADFLAPVPRVVVELDGASHRGRASSDASRDRKLARLGYRVLRIQATLVMEDLDAAVALVRAAPDASAVAARPTRAPPVVVDAAALRAR